MSVIIQKALSYTSQNWKPIILGGSIAFIVTRWAQLCSDCSFVPREKMHSHPVKLLDVFDPLFNMREACKEMTLLEDHLNNERKRCSDCIRKHFLKVEGLLEETKSLDKGGFYAQLLEAQLDDIRIAIDMFTSGQDYIKVSQRIRKVRKLLTPKCFNKGRGLKG